MRAKRGCLHVAPIEEKIKGCCDWDGLGTTPKIIESPPIWHIEVFQIQGIRGRGRWLRSLNEVVRKHMLGCWVTKNMPLNEVEMENVELTNMTK